MVAALAWLPLMKALDPLEGFNQVLLLSPEFLHNLCRLSYNTSHHKEILQTILHAQPSAVVTVPMTLCGTAEWQLQATFPMIGLDARISIVMLVASLWDPRAADEPAAETMPYCSASRSGCDACQTLV